MNRAAWLDPPEWMDDAACRADDIPPDLFFPDPGQYRVASAAKQVCAVCPVRTACLDYALAAERDRGDWSPAGVWGGTTPSERKRLARDQRHFHQRGVS